MLFLRSDGVIHFSFADTTPHDFFAEI